MSIAGYDPGRNPREESDEEEGAARVVEEVSQGDWH